MGIYSHGGIHVNRQPASNENYYQAGREKDGTLTPMQIRNVSNTGAYGNHAGEVLASSLGSAMATYRCSNKKGVGYAVYTNTVPSGAFRGYGATQPTFAIECAMDELGRKVGIDPFAIRRKNMLQDHDPVHSIWPAPHDAVMGSYGFDQCFDLVEKALAMDAARKSQRARIGWKARESQPTLRTELPRRSIALRLTLHYNRIAPIILPSGQANLEMASSMHNARESRQCLIRVPETSRWILPILIGIPAIQERLAVQAPVWPHSL